MTNYIDSALKAGLSPKAGAVYVALLEAGVALAPKNIISKTKLYRQYVYDALRELADKRLIATEGEGRRIKYVAVSPDKLLQEVEKKRIDTLDGVQNLLRLYEKSPAGVVDIIRGDKAATEYDLQQIRDADEGDFLDVIGGGGLHWVRMFEASGRMEEWEALRKKKNVKIRYIGIGEDVRFNKEQSISENESRVIPGIGDLVSVVIRKDSVTFDMYDPDALYVRVKSKAAAASQRALFEVLWAAAK